MTKAKKLTPTEQLAARLLAAEEENTALKSLLEKARTDKSELQKALLDAGTEFNKRIEKRDGSIGKLKGKLFLALQEIWAAKGYLARVAEDDAIRELGPRMEFPAVESVAQPPMSRRNGPPVPDVPEPRRPGYGDAPPPTHWWNL